jgi:hypothetical protein
MYRMDNQEEALAKARQFSENAFGVEMGKIAARFAEKLKQSQARLSDARTIFSGMAVTETANIDSERITALVEARLKTRLEGFDLHDVTLTDGMVNYLIQELTSLRSTWITQSRQAFEQSALGKRSQFPGDRYMEIVEQGVGLHANEVRTELDRWRFMRKKKETEEQPSHIINIHGPVTGSIIQQGDHTTATLNYVTEVEKVLEELRPTLNAAKLTAEAKQELRAEFETVEAQTKSPRPKHTIIKQSLESARHILEHAFGAALAHSYYPLLIEFLSRH